MDIYNLLNITNQNSEQQIKEAIIETREQLKDLNEDSTCIIYSNYLSRNLSNRHILNRIISTGDLGFSYNHQFVLSPKDDRHFYLIDLTYSQFSNSTYDELLENGYMIVNNKIFNEYLEIVGMEQINIKMKDAFYQDNKKVR